MKPKILLLEDDYIQRRNISDAVGQEFNTAVATKSTESEFRADFEQIALDPPEIAILDVMVRWTNPSRNQEALPEEAKQPEVAGLRCADMLRQDPRTQDVKVILYSVIKHEEMGRPIPSGVTAVIKETGFDDLFEKIRNAGLS
jgi:CheY-like chemotaxis protein